MRHLKAGRTLGVKPAHRKAMLRNIVTSLLEKEQIKTTVARAKEMRKPLDNMITLGKRGDLSARRKALGFVKSKEAMAKLFGELAERYKDRPGGFSRIMKLGPRRGDGAEMALILLVDKPDDPFAGESKPRRRGGKKEPKAVLQDVAETVREEASGQPPADAEPAKSSKKAAAEADLQTDETKGAEASAQEAAADDTAPDTVSGGAPEADSGGAPEAVSGGAPEAVSGGAPEADSGDAPQKQEEKK